MRDPQARAKTATQTIAIRLPQIPAAPEQVSLAVAQAIAFVIPSANAAQLAAVEERPNPTAAKAPKLARTVAASASNPIQTTTIDATLTSSAQTLATAAQPARPQSAQPSVKQALKLEFGPGKKSALGTANQRAALPSLKAVRVRVKSGDSLYGILKRRGLPSALLPALLSVGKHGERLKRLRPGQALDFYIDNSGNLQRLEFRPDPLTTVSYKRKGNGFASSLEQTPLEKRERSISGVIENSLFMDGQKVGLSSRTIMRLAEIFGWDVDFALDIRNGDRFTVVYEELLQNGIKMRDGDVLAAEFINRGRVFRAVRFVTPKGATQYYTPDGRSMRKAFLRAPVRFARISSKFNLRRKHPILHKVRAHRGVDYAAASGTPIRATGDGRIQFRGRKRGYGNTIIIRHSGGTYSTLYAHMKGYARGLRSGTSVKQGQVIGYVGKTGLATGPHLHYEFRVRGVHKDPLRVRLPKSLPIASRYRNQFQRQARKLVSKLNDSGATVARRD